jgi:mono/diheme cytochrome c family protein
MKKYVRFFATVLVFISCTTNNKPEQSILSAPNLKSHFIFIQSDSSYSLKTPKGAIIRIAAQSFRVDANSKVEVEIKEAYSLADILLAGLTTESNGKPLQSGGMIFINATMNGKPVELIKPIKISIPTDIYDDRMQLFKGELQQDSSINWVDPQPLDTGATSKKLKTGELLFKANCASCHKIRKDFTGPALAGCRNREPDSDWAYRFTINPALMTDSYAQAIRKQFNNQQMTMFGNHLSRADVNAILDFCDNEASLDPEPVLPNRALKADSAKAEKPCGYDTLYYRKDTSIKILPADTTYSTATINLKPQEEKEYKENMREGFADPNVTTGMYDFEINTFGWYNVDAFFEGYKGATFVTVNAALQMPGESYMHVYLFCPGKKFLSVAYYPKDNNYLFDKVNGKIPLFINDDAIILAFGSKGDKMLYGTAAFKIKKIQTINIPIKETTDAELKSFIQKNNIDGIKIDINKKEDFKIKEKLCDDVITATTSVNKK